MFHHSDDEISKCFVQHAQYIFVKSSYKYSNTFLNNDSWINARFLVKISKTLWGRKKKEKKKRRESVKRRFFPRSRRCYSVSRGRDYYQGIKKSLSDYVSPVPHTHTHALARASDPLEIPKRSFHFRVPEGVCGWWIWKVVVTLSNHLPLNAATLSRGRLSFKVSRIYTQLLPPRSPDYPLLATASCNLTRLFFPDDKYSRTADDLARRIRENIAS